jgi:membrane-associated protease RseP (regulator of RpoE activity)
VTLKQPAVAVVIQPKCQIEALSGVPREVDDLLPLVVLAPSINLTVEHNIVAGLPPGSNVQVSAVRNGRDQNFQVALAELPDKPEPESEETTSTAPGVGNEKFGLTLQPLTAETASRFGLDADDQGLLVTRVDPAGNAASAGIRQGDLIQEVNRQPVRTFAEFNTAMQQSGAKPALVLIKRRNFVTYVTLKAGS